MRAYTFDAGRVHLIRLATGSDISNEITAYARDHHIEAASLTFLGAVTKASLRYYNQAAKAYEDFVIDEHLEVVAGIGNISLLDGGPFLHAHAAFADRSGAAFGGHLNEGTEVWALEVTLTELVGEPPERLPDDCTGLTLWGGDLG